MTRALAIDFRVFAPLFALPDDGLVLSQTIPLPAMAGKNQHSHPETSSQARGSRGQAIVELSQVSERGMSFWSRQRFEIAAELQLRVQRSSLPEPLRRVATGDEEWVMIKGYVVECRAERRAGGEAAFCVSVVWDTTFSAANQSDALLKSPAFTPTRCGATIFGLN
jgi:hypothetical protein